MKNIIMIASTVGSLLANTIAWGAPTQDELEALALKGDYQAQRNLAYSYAVGWGQLGESSYVPKDPIKACAWYRVILMSDNNKIDVGDVSNEWTFCRKLDLVGSGKAWALARNLK